MTDFFHNVSLPQIFIRDSRSVLQYRTDIVESGSGFEFRNNVWSMPRRMFYLPMRVCSYKEARDLQNFFNARGGRLFGFLWSNRLDSSSPTSTSSIITRDDNQPLRALDDTRRVFGLQKIYLDGRVRDITKPFRDTVFVARNRRRLRENIDYTLDLLTGRITFARPQAENTTLTAGFSYHTPVRFDSDSISVTFISPTHARVDEIRLVELPLTHSDYDEA
ncbi:MAG: DUF2460 domain-containing protein [Alphaproteobacteria bacterium]|nr:DUF2460 domain-containing protein [Alphaproteobacteria bacterium]MBE8219826.1 DUF2460 domain-containing protein [Alphaproteobacteria bacterium]